MLASTWFCRVRGSVFGGLIPSLASRESITVLEGLGYDFGFMPSPRSLETKQKFLEAGVIAGLDVLSQSPSLAHVALEFLADVFGRANILLLDVLFGNPEGVDFFRSRPKEEISQFIKIVLPCMLADKPITIVTSTCPDYEPRSYKLGDDVGLFAERTVRGIEALHNFFKKRGVAISVTMHLADGDAADSVALSASGETRDSFLRKTKSSVSKIQHLLTSSGRSQHVRVLPMSDIFDGGVDGYKNQHERSTHTIQSLYERRDKKVVSTVESLLRERKRLGDFDGVADENEQKLLVYGELAGYETYGRRIGGQALIVSPGAKSVVPAYNFNVPQEQVNPIIYIYDKKEKHDLFAD